MRTTVSRDGTTIAFDQSGNGPAIILVGGALSTRAAAVPLAALLAPHFTVYSYDRRGRGASGDTPPYAIAREIEDIAALITVAGGSAALFGMSSGGILVLSAALQLAKGITKLAIYEPPLVVNAEHPPLPSDYVAQLDSLIASGQRGAVIEYFMTRAVMADMPADMVAGIIEQMRRSPQWQDMEAIAPTLPYDGRIAEAFMTGSPEPLRHWSPIAIPTLVLDGGASPAWMHTGADALAAHLPQSDRHTLAEQTHAVDPAVLATALIAYCA